VSYTKRIALHDKISIDGTDVSGSFSQFDLDSTDSDVDVSGFSVSGVDETLSGTRAEGFAGTAFYSEDLATLLWPLHDNRTVFEVSWQPNGLIDPTAAVYYANCQLRTFSPNNARGSASTMPVTLKVADANGVTKAAGT
jgi:hypothetical protein